MREVVPGASIFAVVLANRPPLPFAEVRAPFAPRGFTIMGFLQTHLFCCHVEFSLPLRGSSERVKKPNAVIQLPRIGRTFWARGTEKTPVVRRRLNPTRRIDLLAFIFRAG